ncbi:MAG: GNAT family N-acetyltransferase [Planctomycetota bacterium]
MTSDGPPSAGASRIFIRRWRSDDDAQALTDLVRSAYAHHAREGLRFWATHQSVEDTIDRLGRGASFLAIDGAAYVGTVTVQPPSLAAEVPLYREPDVHSVHQLAVALSHRGCQLGRRLHDVAAAHARSAGAKRLALDTALPAHGLIALYERWGYRVVGRHDFRPFTSYESVILALDLDPAPASREEPAC